MRIYIVLFGLFILLNECLVYLVFIVIFYFQYWVPIKLGRKDNNNAAMVDYYKVLDVPRGATTAEIKKA